MLLLLLHPATLFPGNTELAVGILMGLHLLDTGSTLLLFVLALASARVITEKRNNA